jgi:branched-chain amino acid transport system ATP-binding protein
MALLQVDNLVAGYHKNVVLNGVSLKVEPGEFIALIGHNGAGKTTLLNSVFGILRAREGGVRFNEQAIERSVPSANVARGMALVPQERAVFPNLNVRDNLDLASITLTDRDFARRRVEQVQRLFPILRQRASQLAGTLSGGEQRMLAVGIALMLAPKLLMLDEPSLGLAPLVVRDLMERIHEVNREEGTAILLVEQNVRAALANANRIYVMKLGRMVYDGPPEPLHDKSRLMELF